MHELMWRKSSFSDDTQGNCVEVAPLPDGSVALRDSKHPEREPFTFTRAEMAAWIAGVRAGEFDHLL